MGFSTWQTPQSFTGRRKGSVGLAKGGAKKRFTSFFGGKHPIIYRAITSNNYGL